MAELHFYKYHGLGNDFVLLDARKDKLEGLSLNQLAITLCDRHFGIGADGLLIVWPSTKAHYRMQIINPDGGEAEMCGNGIRCFAKYVYETDKLSEEVLSVETPAGIKLPAVILNADKTVGIVEVDMGIPQIEGEITLSGFRFKRISMGNPHAVALVEDLSKLSLLTLGPKIENDPCFKNRTNVEFVQVLSDQEISVLVWERGAGETLACGTGACAAVVAVVTEGKIKRRAIVTLPGGKLDIEWGDDNHILMRGPAEKVFEGTFLI